MSKYTNLFSSFILALILLSGVFVVNQSQYAVISLLGNPRHSISKPGLYFKIPILETVNFFDSRVLCLEMPELEITLGDKRRIIVDAFTIYKITDPRRFYKAVTRESLAVKRLHPIVLSSLSNILGKVTLPSLLSDNRSSITQKITKEVNKYGKSFGVDILDIQIRKVDLPAQNSEAICARMRSEREREACELRAKGVEISKIIKSTADKDCSVSLSEADRKVQDLIASGEREANKIYAEAASKDPKFFEFFKSLEAYQETFSANNSTLILSPNSEFFKVLKGAKL